MRDSQNRSEQPLSGWAVGGVGFAACIGAFQIALDVWVIWSLTRPGVIET